MWIYARVMCPQIPDDEHHPILRVKVEAASKALKIEMEKTAGVDNIPAELVEAGREAMIDILQDLEDRRMTDHLNSVPSYHTSKERYFVAVPEMQLCQNYRTISLISHPSKVMLKIILNRLQPQAEEIIAEEQAGFRAERSAIEQIFNLRTHCEKYEG